MPVPPYDGSWSLLEQQQWEALSQDFTVNFLNSINQRCGSRIDAYFDFESFRRHFTGDPRAPLDEATHDHARAPFSALVELCSGGGANNNTDPEMNKRAISAKLHRIEVRYGGPAVGSSRIAVGNGVLSVTINPADNISLNDFTVANRTEVLRRL